MEDKNRADLLREFRSLHGFSVVAACKAMQRNYHTWCCYEKGHRNVPEHLIRHIAHYNTLQRLINGG